MVEDKDFEIAISQVNSILNNMSYDDTQKIPNKLKKFLSENNNKEYNIHIRDDIPLNKQGLNPETINLLSLIYRNYWCEDKEEYDKLLMINQKKYDEYLRKKYEIKFYTTDSDINSENVEINQNNLPIDISKEKWYVKFSNFINKIFGKIKNFFIKK